MANSIRLRRSSTAGAVPTTAQLALGELAINTNDGKMYLKKDVSGTESIVQIGGSVTVASSPPGDASPGDIYWDDTEGEAFILYDDGNTEQWVPLSPSADPALPGSEAKMLDDISSSFDGNTATFNLTVNSGAHEPLYENAVLVSLGGVIQQAGTDFTISGSQITFTTNPASGLSFFALDLGFALPIGTPNDGTVTPAKLSTGGPNWDTSGNVGIGTSSPGQPLTINKPSGNTLQAFSIADSVKAYIGLSGATNSPITGALTNDLCFRSENANIKFGTASSTRTDLTIDSSGRLLCGTSTAPTINGGTFRFTLSGNDFSTAGIAAVRYQNSSAGASLVLAKSRGSEASPSALSANDELGKILFVGHDGTDLGTAGAQIRALVDGTPGSNDMPTRLTFETTADGASSPTTQMTIDSSGKVGIGTSTVASGTKLELVDSGTTGLIIRNTNNTSGDVGRIVFAQGTGGTNLASTYIFGDIYGSCTGTGPLTGDLEFRTNRGNNVATTMKLISTGEVQIHNSSSNSSILSLQGGSTSVANGNEFCQIKFLTNDSNVVGSDKECATIVAVAENDHGSSSDAKTGLSFHTRRDELEVPYEQLRISSTGVINARYIFQTGYTVSAGYTGGDSNYIRSFGGSTGNDYVIMRGRYVSNSNYVFASYVGSVLKAEIQADGSFHSAVNTFTATSDARLKENIVDSGSQWEDIKGITVRKFNYTQESGHDTHTQIGVVAQEVELVSPGLVTEKPDLDGDDNDLGTTTKSVKYSVLYMKAVKALQEAMERIETLEAKVAALEAGN